MLAYQLVLIAAILASASSAGLIYAQAPDRRPSQLLASILLLGGGWAASELAVSGAATAETALFWMRVGAFCWVPIGALLPLVVLCSLRESIPAVSAPYRPLLRNLACLEAAWSAVMLVAALGTNGVVEEVLPTTWGWRFLPGPMVPANYAIVTVGMLGASWVIARVSRRASVAESLQLPWVWVALLVPSGVVLVTDVVIPSTGVDFPRFGGASLALTGAILSFTVVYFGMSFVTPRSFGDEILETLHEGVALVSHDGHLVRGNRALAALCGCEVDEMRGLPVGRLLDREVGDDGECAELRRELHPLRGGGVPVSVSVSVLRERRQNEMGYVLVVRDLRELEELRHASMVNARLAAVGQLAAGLAHEINNPVAFVGANLRLLEQYWEKLTREGSGAEESGLLASEGQELIEESLEGVDRAADIVRGVRNFTHTGSSERLPADLAELIADCLKMLRSRRSDGVRIELGLEPVPPVLCCPPEIEQVLLNLLLNAVQAIEGRGRIDVSTHVEESSGVVTIRDDGPGIPPEVLERIFDPFFTTKPAGEGTGLGLGIAHQVVARHGGRITVQSEPGRGATFRVHLPLVAEEAEAISGRDGTGSPA